MIHNLTHNFMILLIVTLLVPNAYSFEVGSKIKAVCKTTGKVYEGTVASVPEGKNILLINKRGDHFKVPVEQVRSVVSVKDQFYTSNNGTKMKVVKIVTKDGQTVYGGLNVSAVIAFNLTDKGSTNLMVPDVHRFSSIASDDIQVVSKL